MKLSDLFNNEVSFIAKILETHGFSARLVGGCIRNVISGKEPSDIDIATDAEPNIVKKLFEKENIKVITTGLQYGTVSLFINDKIFEITSLRKDIKTDGRHATVEYTTSWEEDAQRRDFSMNALYADKNGNLYDYYGGLADLKSGTLRFIGPPDERIKEDYLRILRYYRFLTDYNKNIDKNSYNAVISLVAGLKFLSKERVQQELFKIISKNNSPDVIQIMNKNRVFETLFALDADYITLENLIEIQCHIKTENVKISRFCAIFPSKEKSFYIENFRFSCAELEKIRIFVEFSENYYLDTYLFRMQYLYGKEIIKDCILLKIAQQPAGLATNTQSKTQFNLLNDKLDSFAEMGGFPLRGKDLLERNFLPGESLGIVIDDCKEWWFENLGDKTKEDCINYCMAKKNLL